jgi:hypothetical protein
MKIPEGYILLTIAKQTLIIINTAEIVAVAQAPRGESDVYTKEPGELNSHFRVDEELQVIAKKITKAKLNQGLGEYEG